MKTTSLLFGCLVCSFAFVGHVQADDKNNLAKELEQLDTRVFPEAERDELRKMIRDDLLARRHAVNDRSTAAWRSLKSRQDWQQFRAEKLKALRDSLGKFPKPPAQLKVHESGELSGDGFRVRKLLFESRPGLWVTAHLYVPAKPRDSMPGILICHSHHRPKQHGELQDMGMTWARGGCYVLVMDQLGHGERRQHPFASADDYAKEFRVSRQDYYFRYDTGMQLHLFGDSLIGWMVWDLMRGVDLLLEQPGIDPQRIALLGAVAGGGDPCAVCGALDERISVVAPFNFGGPQPETRYPLPEDAEARFNYAGGGSWESTRNLRLSGRDGFLPWVIVAGVAPRRLIYAHEFSWDRDQDPVWKRFGHVWKWHGAEENLAFAHGSGTLQGRPPESTHCTHIGKVHRRMIHPHLKRWFNLSVGADDEYSNRIDSDQLLCLTPEAQAKLKPKRLVDLLPELADERIAAARKSYATKSPQQRRKLLQQAWSRILGPVAPPQAVRLHPGPPPQTLQGVRIEKHFVDYSEGPIRVPLVLLLPAVKNKASLPVVVAVAQGGKEAFLKHRSEEIAGLLERNVAVCLPDLRGLGETKEDGGRGRYSSATSRSSLELLLGGTMVGQRLRDLRAVLGVLKQDKRIDAKRVAVWGDSFAETNGPGTNFDVPRRVDGRPRQSEPAGGLLALLAGVFEDDVAAVYVQGVIGEFRSVLEHQQVLIPHDVVIPELLTAGDLTDLAGGIAPRPLRLEGLVDGLNRQLDGSAVQKLYAPAQKAYAQAKSADAFSTNGEESQTVRWLAAQLTGN